LHLVGYLHVILVMYGHTRNKFALEFPSSEVMEFCLGVVMSDTS